MSKIIKQLDNDEYHALASFSSSQIKDFINHPPKYFQAKHIAKTLPRVESESMKIGSATHAYWMEPERFDTDYAIEPDCDGRTKAGKAIKAKFKELAQDKTIITQKQGEIMSEMCKALNDDKNARGLLARTDIENSIFWTDEETGLDLRIRPDMWRQGTYIADLKTTRDASPHAFVRSIYDFGYHISAAMYLDGMKQLGQEITDFVFICVESSAPYLTATYTLSDDALQIGHREYRAALNGIKHCLDSNTWCDYNGGEVAEISLPIWVLNREAANQS